MEEKKQSFNRGSNTVYIACKTELQNVIRANSGKEDQHEGFWVMKRLLTQDQEFKRQIIEKYGQEVYDSLVKHYSKTNIEQRKEREFEDKIRQKKEEQKLEIEKLKAEAYSKQVEKQEDNSPISTEELEARVKANQDALRTASSVQRANLQNAIERDKRELAVRKELESKKPKEGENP